MKNFIYILLFFGTFMSFKAQEKPNFREMTPEQRREYIKQMSPEQRKQLMEDAATMMVIKNLQVPAEKQEAFKILLKEYLESQKTIKNKFRADFSQENLSDAEAKKMLNQSFDLGQQLLNNRKVYADKFLKILTPQQVLKLLIKKEECAKNLWNADKKWDHQKAANQCQILKTFKIYSENQFGVFYF